MPKSTPEQTFTKLYNLATDPATPEHERKSAEGKMKSWLKRHGKTARDYPAIFAKAAADELAQNPPSPSSDPRTGTPHPYGGRTFSPADVVERVIGRYVTMTEPVAVISTLWPIFTHVYQRFAIAPRLALTSEEPDSGKSTLRKVLGHLVYRPNGAAFSIGAALTRHIARGPCTVLLDEFNLAPANLWPSLLRIWNLGHERGEKIALMDKGEEREFDIHAPMLAVGLGSFMREAQLSRAYRLDLQRYTEETTPERDYRVNPDIAEFVAVYSYVDEWVRSVELNPDPPMPSGLITRHADNARGLVSVADACGPPWPQRIRAVVMLLHEKDMAERPQIKILRHGLLLFKAFEVTEIGSGRFNNELKRLDLPDANWDRYRGPSGGEYAHSLRPSEQAGLLEKSDIYSIRIRPPGENQCRGYTIAMFEEAQRKYDVAAPSEAEVGRARLRLVRPPSD